MASYVNRSLISGSGCNTQAYQLTRRHAASRRRRRAKTTTNQRRRITLRQPVARRDHDDTKTDDELPLTCPSTFSPLHLERLLFHLHRAPSSSTCRRKTKGGLRADQKHCNKPFRRSLDHRVDGTRSITTRTNARHTPIPRTLYYIPRTETHVAQAALQGFQPFISNPNKQPRSTDYLRTHAEPG